MGYSREPPVFTRFGHISVETKFTGSAGTCQSGSPPGVGPSHAVTTLTTFFEDEDDDEDEYEAPPLRGHQPGRQIDRERQYDRVEQKREQRVD